jgi:hypothetical protein
VNKLKLIKTGMLGNEKLYTDEKYAGGIRK